MSSQLNSLTSTSTSDANVKAKLQGHPSPASDIVRSCKKIRGNSGTLGTGRKLDLYSTKEHDNVDEKENMEMDYESGHDGKEAFPKRKGDVEDKEVDADSPEPGLKRMKNQDDDAPPQEPAAATAGRRETLNPKIKLYFNQVIAKSPSLPVKESITCLEFNKDGEYLAACKESGIITVFRRSNKNKTHSTYDACFEFQSFDPYVHHTKNRIVDPEVVSACWLDNTHTGPLLLCSNEATTKLWKIVEEKSGANYSGCFDNMDLQIPKSKKFDPSNYKAYLRREYKAEYDELIHSISLNMDQQTFIASDYKTVHLFNLEYPKPSLLLVQLPKDEDVKDLELLTCLQFQPNSSSVFVCGSLRGLLRLYDMRQKTRCDENCKVFSAYADYDGMSMIRDMKFSNCGRYIATRDYYDLKIYDIQMDKTPVATYDVQRYMNERINEACSNESSERFGVLWSTDNEHVITGGYDKLFHVTNRNTTEHSTWTLPDDSQQKMGTALEETAVVNVKRTFTDTTVQEVGLEDLNLSKTISTFSCHPKKDLYAFASGNTVFLVKSD